MRVIRTPFCELLVFAQHRVDHLIEHVVGRLAEERRVRMQRFCVLSIEPRDMADDLFSAGPWFDERHLVTPCHAGTSPRSPPESGACCATIGGLIVGRES